MGYWAFRREENGEDFVHPAHAAASIPHTSIDWGVELFEADAGSINFSCGGADEVDLSMILFSVSLDFCQKSSCKFSDHKRRAQVKGRGHMTTYILSTSLHSGGCLMKHNYSNNNRFQVALWRLLIVRVNQVRGCSIINHVTEAMRVLPSREITGAWRGIVLRLACTIGFVCFSCCPAHLYALYHAHGHNFWSRP